LNFIWNKNDSYFKLKNQSFLFLFHHPTDSLGAEDMDGNPFYEPTRELKFVRNLESGHFTILLLPTQIAGLQRWQIFSYNSRTELIDSFNVERSTDGRFNTKGTQLYTSPDPQYQKSVLEREPGTCPFTGQDMIPLVSDKGYAETALCFGGKGNYIRVPDADSLNISEELTIEAWVYLKDSTSNQKIVSKALWAGEDAGGYIFGVGSKQLYCDFWNHEHENYEFRGGTISNNKWNHLAITWATNGEIIGYINGKAVGTMAAGAQPIGKSLEDLIIGAAPRGSAFYVEGIIDEVRIWNVARTEHDLKSTMHQRLVGNEPGLAGYWRFDEGSGTKVYDQTDNANHGTIKGTLTFKKSDAPIGDQPGIRRTSFTFKKAKKAKLDFDGSNYIKVPNADSLNITEELTIEAWVQLKGTSNNQKIVSKALWTGKVPAGYILGVGSIGGVIGLYCNFWNPKKTTFRGGTISKNKWTHLAITWATNGEIIGYINGKAVGTMTAGAQPIGTNLEDLIIGAAPRPYEYKVDGIIDEVRIWNIARTKHDLKSTMHRRLVGNEPGLAGYWRFDEGSGEKVYDQTDNANNGTIQGNAKWVSSDAPIHDQPPGLSALLYFQQEQAATGHEPEKKPLKRNARVMLVMTTSQVAALDFAVSNQGRLAQVPGKINLGSINSAGGLPLISTDPMGLTVNGAILNFTSVKPNVTPLLFESATGQLGLYFQGINNDEFTVAHFETTQSAKAQYSLNTKYDVFIGRTAEDTHLGVTELVLVRPVGTEISRGKKLRIGGDTIAVKSITGNRITLSNGISDGLVKGTPIYLVDGGPITGDDPKKSELYLIARSAGDDANSAKITVADDDSELPDYCTVKIGEEDPWTWKRVPRQVQKFAATLNGTANERMFVGTLTGKLETKYSELTVAGRIKHSLQKGDTLQVGGKTRVVVSDTWDPTKAYNDKDNKTTIPIGQSPITLANQGAFVNLSQEYFGELQEALSIKSTSAELILKLGNKPSGRTLEIGDTLLVKNLKLTVASKKPAITVIPDTLAGKGTAVYWRKTTNPEEDEYLGKLQFGWDCSDDNLYISKSLTEITILNKDDLGSLNSDVTLTIGGFTIETAKGKVQETVDTIEIPIDKTSLCLAQAGKKVYRLNNTQFIGKLTDDLSNDDTGLAVDTEGSLLQTLEAEDLISINELQVTVQSQVSFPTNSNLISIAIIKPDSINLPIFLLAYDYDHVHVAGRKPKFIVNPALAEFIVNPALAEGRVQDTEKATQVVTGASSKWISDPVEYSLQGSLSQTDPGKLAKFDAQADVSLETWVQSCDIFALSFNGVDDSVSLGSTNGLEVKEGQHQPQHTIEAWVYLEHFPDKNSRSWLSLLGQNGPGACHWLVNHDGSMQVGVYGTGLGW